MANWCSNTVVFEGKPEAIRRIQQLFQYMKEKEAETEQGQLPDFLSDTNGGYFFNLYWNEGDEGIYQYETKWSPNLEVVKAMAEYYQVNFVQHYEESGSLIYGVTTYKDRILTDTYLDGSDWDAYDFDEDTDTYHFEGKEYDGNCEILEILLKRKIVVL